MNAQPKVSETPHPCNRTKRNDPCDWELLHNKVQAKWQAAERENAKLRAALEASKCECKFYPEGDPDVDVKHGCARCAALA